MEFVSCLQGRLRFNVGTAEEIIQRIKDEHGKGQFRSWVINDLYGVLTYEEAGELLKPTVTKEGWGEVLSRNSEEVAERIVSYLPFAINKAVEHRGISAGRSIDHFRDWVWLLGDSEAEAFINDRKNYPMYGAPVLSYSLNRFGVSYAFTQEERRVFDLMSQGKCCGRGDCDFHG